MIDLYSPGAYCRVPGGNLERPDLQAPVVKWMAWNIGGDVNRDPAAWDRSRMLWNGAGIQNFPWLHCRNMIDIDFLMDVGKRYASPAIGLNIEDVTRDFLNNGVSLQDIAQKLAGWPNPIHMPTLPWVDNGAGWSILNRCVAALEIFPSEQSIWPNGTYSSVICLQCIEHAENEGLTQITLMLKTKGYTPASFGPEWGICHSLYTADDLPPTADGWLAWQMTEPCERLGSVKIGKQDGIAASIERLRKLDPAGTRPNRKPDDLSTWGAYDKLERTLQILKEDHDANE